MLQRASSYPPAASPYRERDTYFTVSSQTAGRECSGLDVSDFRRRSNHLVLTFFASGLQFIDIRILCCCPVVLSIFRSRIIDWSHLSGRPSHHKSSILTNMIMKNLQQILKNVICFVECYLSIFWGSCYSISLWSTEFATSCLAICHYSLIFFGTWQLAHANLEKKWDMQNHCFFENSCSDKQPLAATSSHLPKQPLAATCSHLQPLVHAMEVIVGRAKLPRDTFYPPLKSSKSLKKAKVVKQTSLIISPISAFPLIQSPTIDP